MVMAGLIALVELKDRRERMRQQIDRRWLWVSHGDTRIIFDHHAKQGNGVLEKATIAPRHALSRLQCIPQFHEMGYKVE